jgi:type I restriction enzyme S subunit
VSGLPQGWKEITLSELGSFSKGKGISKNEVIDTGYPCIRYAEIYTEHDYVIKEFKSFINEESAKNSTDLLVLEKLLKILVSRLRLFQK